MHVEERRGKKVHRTKTQTKHETGRENPDPSEVFRWWPFFRVHLVFSLVSSSIQQTASRTIVSPSFLLLPPVPVLVTSHFTYYSKLSAGLPDFAVFCLFSLVCCRLVALDISISPFFLAGGTEWPQ